jgi:molecular chaperone DnaK (HSP70)
MNKPTLGIDLGTYNSAAAVLAGKDDPVPISASPERRFWGRSNERIKPFPSVVVYHADGTVRAVGCEAKELAEQEPAYAVWGVKRLLGKTYREAKDHGELDRMLLRVEPDGSNGRCMFELGDNEIRPEQVCGELLRYIRSAAQRQTGMDLSEVVISVPAYFDAIAISATVEAAKLAGFGQVETIPEPVAAALAYDLQVTPRPVNFLVFDIGAGTLDVTAAEVWRTHTGPGGLECRCKKNTGDTHLGGLDMDDCLLSQVQAAMAAEFLSDEERLALRRAVEAAKIRLSTEAETSFDVTVQGARNTHRLTRFELEGALRSGPRDLLAACEQQVREALDGAGWKRVEQVDRVLLVGGPTAMPCVRGVLEGVFRRNPAVLAQIREADSAVRQAVDPMLAVAVGAAKSRGTQVTKIHPYGYGFVNVRIEPLPGEPMNLITREPALLVPRDSVFPSKPAATMPDTISHRGKVSMIEIIQHVPSAEQRGQGHGAGEFRFLGEFQLAFTGAPRMLRISMELNENGELETTIRTGRESVTYVGVGCLGRDPIELPTRKKEAQRDSQPRWVFVRENAEAVRQWGRGFARFLLAKVTASARRDRYVGESLDRLQVALTRWGAYPEGDVTEVFNGGKELLLRAQEVKMMDDSERHRWEDELDAAHSRCYRHVEQ